MTKNEAKTIPIVVHTPDCPTCKHQFENEIDCARSYCRGRIDYEPKEGFVLYVPPPSIAQSIRDAAINWPQYLGVVECGVLNNFCSFEEKHKPMGYLQGKYPEKLKNQSRTFMLLVAEALE